MQLGDLVMFRNCSQEGKLGVIAIIPNHDTLYPPGCWLYWVIHEEGMHCFTGNQLVIQ
jgi:hypothetical protein